MSACVARARHGEAACIDTSPVPVTLVTSPNWLTWPMTVVGLLLLYRRTEPLGSARLFQHLELEPAARTPESRHHKVDLCQNRRATDTHGRRGRVNCRMSPRLAVSPATKDDRPLPPD